MQWLRTITRFVRALIVLFLFAQFAGVVSSPLASAQTYANAFASHRHHQHVHYHGRGEGADRHGDQDRDHADHCCALHAFFAGIMPPVIEIGIADRLDQRLFADLTDIAQGMTLDRLDRPPRPLV